MNSSTPHLLVVDDDTRILALLEQFLKKNGFLVSTTTSVEGAKELLKNFTFDLIILDVMLPDVTGTEFAMVIKAESKTPPIIMLTALSEPKDRVAGLEAGANDYMTKPFEPRELLLRINNLVAAHMKNNLDKLVYHFGNNKYDLTSKEFTKNNEVIYLSATEQNLLEILLQSAGELISREQLSAKMGGLNLRSVDVQIARVRNKIEDNPKEPRYLKTIRNGGYALYT